MKISIDDVKKALEWLRANSLETHVDIQMHPGLIRINSMDRYQTSVEIKIFDADSSTLPKIRRESVL